jgi:hypothetical protein
VEHNVAGRVAWAVANVEGQLADRRRVAVLEPAVRLEWLTFDTPPFPVIVEPRDPETIGLVRAFDRNAEILREDSRRPAMVDVTVGPRPPP